VLLGLVVLAVVAAGYLILRRPAAELAPSGIDLVDVTGSVPAGSPIAGGLPDNTVATRIVATPDEAPELASSPTAWLRVTDSVSGRPVAGAAVCSAQGGVELAFTDEAGIAPLPLSKPQQLAVVADGYLLRLVPAQLDSSAEAPQETRMVSDGWSHRMRLHFTVAGAKASGDVWVMFRRLDQDDTLLTPTGDDAVIKRAWQEHSMLARMPVGKDLALEDGSPTADRAHRLQGDGEVRFLAAGRFRLTAATAAGRVAQCDVVIPARIGGRSDLTIALEPGATLTGNVVAPDGHPLADATVQLQGGDPLGLVATTGAGGAFALGPLAPGQVRLHVHHFDHEPLAFGPVDAGATGVRITMQPLPASVVRGRVRSRPDLQPIEGAVVVWTVDGGAPVTVRTDDQGRFALRATGDAPARLLVQAQGFVPYAELVEPGAPFADYDVLPAVPAVRVEKGLSALLCGAVVDSRGQPVVGVPIRWVPLATTAPALPGAIGRRTLEGAVLDLPGLATTGVDGAFALETTRFGDGRLCLPDDVNAPSRGLRVEAIAGETRNGLTLRR